MFTAICMLINAILNNYYTINKTVIFISVLLTILFKGIVFFLLGGLVYNKMFWVNLWTGNITMIPGVIRERKHLAKAMNDAFNNIYYKRNTLKMKTHTVTLKYILKKIGCKNKEAVTIIKKAKSKKNVSLLLKTNEVDKIIIKYIGEQLNTSVIWTKGTSPKDLKLVDFFKVKIIKINKNSLIIL